MAEQAYPEILCKLLSYILKKYLIPITLNAKVGEKFLSTSTVRHSNFTCFRLS